MLKLLTVVGARPQFIKAAAISRALRTHHTNEVEEVILHTGQHYDPKLSKVFFEELNIPKENYNLNIGSGSHAEQTAKMLVEVEKVILKENPDAVLLYGDTNSTLAACLAAIKLGVHIIHVEAGVRSYNKGFPEEVNRLICDHMASILFVPSDAGMESLGKEGFNLNSDGAGKAKANSPKVFRCGDIMYDNTLHYQDNLPEGENSVFNKYDIPGSNYILTTMHRPSNVDDSIALQQIFSALDEVIAASGRQILLPLHPRTVGKLESLKAKKGLIMNPKIKVLPPVSFLEMVALEKNADLIITDSGGVQKEAYFMEKPCLIMLEETPWVELIDSGAALLCGSDREKIVKGASYFLNEKPVLKFGGLYGDGMASEFICQKIIECLN
ncbi:MAG: UDP-N-acetylglucosamine 2-epimerase (non-hydrolyzing) [Flavobacteriales bacterium]|nr:UDP-N-acetylglucosamine 2-epimerase (non-hydrolyzing) [Flavobacteriales bacterium]